MCCRFCVGIVEYRYDDNNHGDTSLTKYDNITVMGSVIDAGTMVDYVGSNVECSCCMLPTFSILESVDVIDTSSDFFPSGKIIMCYQSVR